MDVAKAYDALCWKIGCKEIYVGGLKHLIAYFSNVNDFQNANDPRTAKIPLSWSLNAGRYFFWIDDFIAPITLPISSSKKDIVSIVFRCLAKHSLTVNRIELMKGLTIEQLLIEYDLKH